MIFTQRVYLTNDHRYVGEGDPDAAFLIHPVGDELSDRLVAERGLEAFVAPGRRVPTPFAVITTDAAGYPVVATPGAPLSTPVGTTPPGHATASVPGVPAAVAPVVVANAAGSHPSTPATATEAADRSQSSRAGGKPARSREV